MSRSCVTVEMFEVFCTATGYITVAERHRRGGFRLNELIEHRSAPDQRRSPAFMMSREDVDQWLRWKGGYRLPSEA